jgi:indole-3-glycerol phosphate synthase
MASNKLEEIIARKHQEVKNLLPRLDKLRAAALLRNDFRSMERHLTADPTRLGLIAEVKKASPSVGIISTDFNPVRQAKAYESAGADAISVLTDELYFQGKLEYLTQIRASTNIPALRKDFIVHEVQIHEAVVAGADAILLIVAALAQDDLIRLMDLAHTLQLECLIEVHDLAELDRALETDARLIGVNNRNLKTFQVDLSTTETLAEEVGDDIILIGESGIKTPEDARRLAEAGVDALLVGESLMRSDDIHTLVREFKAPKPARQSP